MQTPDHIERAAEVIHGNTPGHLCLSERSKETTVSDPLDRPCTYCHAYPINGSERCPGTGDGMHRRTEHALATPAHDAAVAAKALRDARDALADIVPPGATVTREQVESFLVECEEGAS